MPCRWERRIAAYRAGLLSLTARQRLAAHLPGCARCRAIMAQSERTEALMDGMPRRMPPRDLWPGIEARLQPRGTSVLRRAWRPATAMAMAVVILLVAVIWVLPMGGGPTTMLSDQGDYAEAQLAAAWDGPLADNAALGWAMLAMMDENPTRGVAD